MKILALYKTFDGPEFVVPSIESIYSFCDMILFIHSETSWTGERGNKVIREVDKWVYKYDKDKKINQILGDWNSQDAQYKYGFQISEVLDHDYKFIIDSDEIWRKEDLLNLKQALIEDGNQHDRFTCRMRTYAKSPFYRIFPTEPCCPTIIVKNGLPYTGIRGDGLPNKKHLDNVYFDHFCYVRKDIESIKNKFKTSEIGDKNPSHNWEEWKTNKWDKLPNVIDFHPTKSHENCWHSVEIIKREQLPKTVQKMGDLECFQL